MFHQGAGDRLLPGAEGLDRCNLHTAHAEYTRSLRLGEDTDLPEWPNGLRAVDGIR
ncbi:hypothetical protein [Saccharothrix sp. Mg75]|uniref:hypothetical protein n=1 Tax=Saccharothrix sp. Mg75 TaxID=3445357 RepID=UPI003EE8B696